MPAVEEDARSKSMNRASMTALAAGVIFFVNSAAPIPAPLAAPMRRETDSASDFDGLARYFTDEPDRPSQSLRQRAAITKGTAAFSGKFRTLR